MRIILRVYYGAALSLFNNDYSVPKTREGIYLLARKPAIYIDRER